MNAWLVAHGNDMIHATVVVWVVLCATVLGATGQLDRNTLGNVYLAVIGYAAGRAGPGAVRTLMSRTSDKIEP